MSEKQTASIPQVQPKSPRNKIQLDLHSRYIKSQSKIRLLRTLQNSSQLDQVTQKPKIDQFSKSLAKMTRDQIQEVTRQKGGKKVAKNLRSNKMGSNIATLSTTNSPIPTQSSLNLNLGTMKMQFSSDLKIKTSISFCSPQSVPVTPNGYSYQSIQKLMQFNMSHLNQSSDQQPKYLKDQKDVVKRAYDWHHKKQIRTDKKIRQKSIDQLSSCTFSPKIHRIPSFSKIPSQLGNSRSNSYTQIHLSRKTSLNRKIGQMPFTTQPASKPASRQKSYPLLSPSFFTKRLGYSTGCNFNHFLQRAKPMVDYKGIVVSKQQMGQDSTIVCAKVKFRNMILQVHSGSALDVNQDQAALVNAANENLEHRGGIAGMIRRRGGQQIQVQSNWYVSNYGQLRTSQAVFTTAGHLKFICVIHVVGPRVNCNSYGYTEVDLQQKNQLVRAVFNSMVLAEQIRARTVVIPLVSSGIFGFPIGPAAKCHIDAFKFFAQQPHVNLQKVIFCLFRIEELQEILKQVLQGKDTFWSQISYFGTPTQQAQRITFCKICSTSRTLHQLAISYTCCSQICNFCIFQYKLTICPQCQKFFYTQNFTYTLCQLCKNLWFPGHLCRKICSNCISKIVPNCLCGTYFTI